MTNPKPITHTESSEKKRPVGLTNKFRIEKFEPLMKSYKPGESLWSEGVASKLAPHAVWEMRLYPNGDTEKSKIAVYLHLGGPMEDNEETLDAAYRIYIVDASGNKIDVAERETKNFGGEGWGCEVDHERVKKALQADGSLLVVADIEFLPYGDGDDVAALSESNLRTQWLDSIDKLRETGTNSDCTLMVGGELLKAHRSILAAISPTFERMFGNEAHQEAKDGIVRIEDSPGMLKDSSAKPYRALLCYAYTGQVDWVLYGECMRDVLVLACKYLIDHLKHHVEEMLFRKISAENFVELVLLADAYSCDELKKVCVEYLSSNSTVMFTQQWEELVDARGDLTKELVRLVREGKTAAEEGGAK